MQIIDNAGKICLRQRLEHDYLVKTVQELRSKRRPHVIHDLLLSLLADLTLRRDAVEQIRRAEVRRQNYDRVLEVNRASLTVSDTSIVENLKQYVEHIRMRLLNLIEQHNAVRMTSHRLGQLTALVISDVSGRRSDQSRHTELLHVLSHINTHKVMLIVKQALRQSLRELRLADARRAKEHELNLSVCSGPRCPRALNAG